MDRLIGVICLAAVMFTGCATSPQQRAVGKEAAKPEYLVINEIASDGDYEFVELFNTSGNRLEFSGDWYIIDENRSGSEDERPLIIPEGTSMEPYGHLLLCPAVEKDIAEVLNDKDLPPGALCDISFSLSSHDSVSLYQGDLLVDTLSWATDMNSYGRVADGLPELSADLMPTPGTVNRTDQFITAEPSLLINEVNSRGEDYIELINTSEGSLVIEAETWSLEDVSRRDSYFLPAQVVPAGGILLLSETDSQGFSLRLGSSDTVTLRVSGTIADRISWSEHVNSLSRNPDGEGSWDEASLSPGKANTSDQ